MPASAHIGFYSHRDASIGQFQDLLYLPFDGGWEGTPEPLRAFFAQLPSQVSRNPKLDHLAVATREHFVQQRGVGSVETANRLDVYAEWFYKVSLEGIGWMDAFQVKHVAWEGSTWPHGRSVVWEI